MSRMNSAKDFQLTFERLRSARQRRRTSRRSSNGDGDEVTGSSTKDSAAHRNRPLTALAIHSRSTASTADTESPDHREEYRPPRLTSELSMPAMHVMEAGESDLEGGSREPGRICSSCGCRQQSLDLDSELPWRSTGKASKATDEVVSIPSFGLEQLNLQHCKSQDEVEAELAKRVGVGVRIPEQEGNEGDQAERMAQGTLSALFMLLSNAELLGEIGTELREVDGASDLAALLTLCKSKSERLQSSQDCSTTAREMSFGLSAALLNKITSELQWMPEASGNSFNTGKKRKMSGAGQLVRHASNGSRPVGLHPRLKLPHLL